jgi:hypothetical protein
MLEETTETRDNQVEANEPWVEGFTSYSVSDVPVVQEGTGRDTAYLALKQALSEYDELLVLDTLEVEIPLDENGVRHYFGRHDFTKSYQDELTLKVMSVANAITLPACGYCVSEPSAVELANRLVNKAVGLSLEAALSIKELKPLDHNFAEIIANITNVMEHAKLCLEFQSFESSVEESITDIIQGTTGPDYDAYVQSQCNRVVNDTNELANQTLRSSKLLYQSRDELISRYAISIVSDELVRIVLAPLYSTLINSAQGEKEELVILANLAFTTKRNSWRSELVELPLWLAKLLQTFASESVQSLIYFKDDLDPETLSIAEVLWGSESYNPSTFSFDSAVDAAKRV